MPDSMGTDFWLAFPPNCISGGVGTATTLYITSALGANGTVACPGLGFSAGFTVAPNGVAVVSVTLTATLGNAAGFPEDLEIVESKGVHVTASAPIAVYGMDMQVYSSDGFLALPGPLLGTDYYALGYPGVVGASAAVVACQDSTVLTVTLPVNYNGHLAGAPYTVDLNQGQTYLMQAASTTLDFSGTHFQSNQPVVVYGGSVCAYIPAADPSCNILVEELFPTNAWGTDFLSVPFATRTGGDTFRVLAGQDNTSVSVNGANVAVLNRGAFWEGILTAASEITATHPVLAAQYSNSCTFGYPLGGNNPQSDPSEMQLQAVEQYSSHYVLGPGPSMGSPLTNPVFANYLNLVVPNAAVAAVTLNGAAVPASAFAPIGASGYQGGMIPVSCAACVVDAPLPFGVAVYGYGATDAYSYPGGFTAPTPTSSPTPTLTRSPTVTPTATPSATPVQSPTITNTFSATPTVTETLTPTPTRTPTPLPFLLTPHYPNPDPGGVNGLWLPYSTTAVARIDLKVYDISGELVRDWEGDPDLETPGDHERHWDANNRAGRTCANGVFLVRIHGLSLNGTDAVVWEKCALVR